MTEITGSDLDLNPHQPFLSGLQLSGGNLVTTQNLGGFSSGGLTSFESSSAYTAPVENQFAAVSYETYGQGGVADLGLTGGQGGSFGSYSFESSTGGGYGAGVEGGLGLAYGAEDAAAFSEAAAYGSSASFGAGGAFGALEGATGGLVEQGGFSASSAEFSSSGAGLSAGAGAGAGAGAVLPLNAYRIQADPSPTVVRRALTGASTVHRQNVIIRFLRPPAPPAPGPLIIKEVRPPQPKPAPPLVIRQRPPRPRTPPALVLRERPPRMPVVTKTQTVIKRLAAIPAPPRQVIIERYPALPAKPRDVIIERWLQYGPLPRRKVIYQRAAAARAYRTPKNLIVQYTAPRPAVQRVFRRLGVMSVNPLSYASQYGASLLDSASIVSAARNAGVVENITPPGLVYAVGGAGAVSAGSGAFSAGSGYLASEDLQLTGGFGGAESSLALAGGDASYSAYQTADYGLAGFGGLVSGGAADLSSTATQYTSYGTSGFEGYSGAEFLSSGSGFASAVEAEGSATTMTGGFEYGGSTESVEGAGNTVAVESYESSTVQSSEA
ncbi:hypothetical protein ACOME3_008160 [Neoechinorhynchus agilis]